MISSELKQQLIGLANYPKELGGVIRNDKIEIIYLGEPFSVKLDWTGEIDILFHTHPHPNDPPSPRDIVYVLASVMSDLAHIVYDALNGIEHSPDTYLSVKNYIVATPDQIYHYYPTPRLVEEIYNYLWDLFQNEEPEQALSDALDKMTQENLDYLSAISPLDDEYLERIRNIGIMI